MCRGSNLLSADGLVGNGPFCPFLDISMFYAFLSVCLQVCFMSARAPLKDMRSGLINYKHDPL